MLLMSNKILWQSVFHVHSPLKFNATEIPWHGNQFCAHWAATAEWGRASISTSLHNMAFQIASLKMEMCAKAHHTSLNAGKLLETSTKPALRMTSFRSSNEMLHIWMLLVNLFFFIALINTVVPLFDSSNLRRSYSDCLQYKNIRSKPRHTENESITFIIWNFSPPFSLSIDAKTAWVGVIWLAYSLIYCSIELFVKRKPQIQRNKSIKPKKKNIIPSCWLLAANIKHL